MLSPPGQGEVSREAKNVRVASVNLCPFWKGNVALILTQAVLLRPICETPMGAYMSVLNHPNNTGGSGDRVGHSKSECLLGSYRLPNAGMSSPQLFWHQGPLLL